MNCPFSSASKGNFPRNEVMTIRGPKGQEEPAGLVVCRTFRKDSMGPLWGTGRKRKEAFC